MLQQRIQALCSRFQLPLPVPDAAGRTFLTFGGAPSLSFLPVPGGVLLECVVAVLPSGAAEREHICHRALSLSLSRTLWEWREGLAPCLTATKADIRVQLRLPGGEGLLRGGGSALADQQYFEDAVERLLNLAETWRNLLEKDQVASGASELMARFPGVWA